jgi:IMP dehydrogenase/GMP reductase
MKFDFNDITIVPAMLSDIRSRSEVNISYLPLIVAPMDTVIDDNNLNIFKNNKLLTCSIRGKSPSKESYDFISLSLEQFLDTSLYQDCPYSAILIDIANGHMKALYDGIKEFKSIYPNIPLMVGNIANPETYRMYCEILTDIDYCRLSIGAGAACTTSANTGVHYPIASLIQESYDISCKYNNPPKIVGDGGFRNFDDIIKGLYLGADYIMIGSLLAKSLEACGKTYLYGFDVTKYKNYLYNKGFKLQRKYRGMSTKEVQKTFGNEKLKTSEGISFYQNVDYKLNSWLENFDSYLRSAMSYCNCKELKDFIGQNNYIKISEQAIKRYKK